MPILLPESSQTATESLTPRQIVAELDKHVVGQAAAKRAVAIALRNRMRRQKLPPEVAEEIAPKNILMIGPTGVGKTEIARRLAKLAQSPFIKVEASKFTEVGYVGRDVESMVRDLVELGVQMIRDERVEEVREKAQQQAEERLLDLLLPPARPSGAAEDATATREQPTQTRDRIHEQLRSGRLDTRTVDVDVRERSMPSLEIVAGTSVEEVGINLNETMQGLFQGGRSKKRKMKVPEALKHLTQEEEQKLVDMESVARAAKSAMVAMASSVKVSAMPSVPINAWYCFTSALRGSVRMRMNSSLPRASSSTRMGKRPCNSGMRSDGFETWKAPAAMKRM